MADVQTFVIERDLDAPVGRVWRALTSIDDLKKWCSFFPDFKPEVGFVTEFMLGPDDEHQYKHQVKVLEAVPNQKLSYTWNYGGMSPNSNVSFELSARGATTHLRLTCYIDPVPSDPPDFMKGTSSGWNHIADELKRVVEVKG